MRITTGWIIGAIAIAGAVGLTACGSRRGGYDDSPQAPGPLRPPSFPGDGQVFAAALDEPHGARVGASLLELLSSR